MMECREVISLESNELLYGIEAAQQGQKDGGIPMRFHESDDATGKDFSDVFNDFDDDDSLRR